MSRKQLSNHLTSDQLEELVRSNDSILSEIHQHLEECETCQSRLESTTAEPWWWNEGRLLVGSSIELLDRTSQPLPNPINDDARFDPLTAEIEALVKSFGAPIHPELLGNVDGYEVQSLLGVGGMGAVFRGFDRELNRPIAIKFLLPRHAQTGLSRQRFSREAKAVAAVRNDNVIPVFRINSKSKYPYFAMPLIPGDSLEQHVIAEGTPAPIQIVQIASQIAAGLAAAHDKGLIHRDIKPANILLENSCNRVVVTDFGLAHDESELNLTQTGMIAGTPQYMSPEQADGKPLDARTDLFSLGAVMYWMATGKPPFNGNGQLDLLKNIRQQRHREARSLNPTIPLRLSRTIDRLLEKNPSNRFETARDVEHFLTQYSAYLNAPDKNTEPRLRGRRRSAVWPLVVALAVLLALFALAAFIFPQKQQEAGPNAKRLDITVIQGKADFTNSIDMMFNLIPAGKFLMGSNGVEHSDEFQHEVAITKPFYIGKFEVTHGQFREFVEATNYVTEAERPDGIGDGISGSEGRPIKFSWRNIGPLYEPTDYHPVLSVSWNDAVAFCKWISSREGKNYRLPTEAEWEYACRAGTNSAFSFGDRVGDFQKYGRLVDETFPAEKKVPIPVGSIQTNQFGLFAMHGNLAEWCSDWYDADYYKLSPANDPTGPKQGTARVIRGGAFLHKPDRCRSAARGNDLPSNSHYYYGFRVVLETE